MAEKPANHSSDNTSEQVGFRLLQTIVRHENRDNGPDHALDRRYLLDLYAECLNTVRLPHRRVGA